MLCAQILAVFAYYSGIGHPKQAWTPVDDTNAADTLTQRGRGGAHRNATLH